MEKERVGRLNLARDILLGVALAGGVVVLLAVAPGLGVILKPFAKRYRKRSLETSQLKRRLDKLQKSGLLAISESGEKTKLILTTAGKQKALEYQVESMAVPTPTEWDGLYRFVMFDIPEKKRVARDVFRRKLIDLGFKKIQHSVWRHKHPCTKEVEFLAHLYEVGKYVDVVEGRQVL